MSGSPTLPLALRSGERVDKYIRLETASGPPTVYIDFMVVVLS